MLTFKKTSFSKLLGSSRHLSACNIFRLEWKLWTVRKWAGPRDYYKRL